MVCLSVISKMTEWFKDRNIQATKIGWSSLCGRRQALSTSLSLALCVSSLRCWACWAVSPMKAAVSSHPVLWLWVWIVGPDNVEFVNPAPAPANFNVLCHSILISLAKAETPLIRFALEFRNTENLGSCPVPPDRDSFILAYQSEHWDTLTHVHSHWHLIRIVSWDQKRDRYEEGNNNNIQGLEALIAWDTTSTYSRSCPTYVWGHPYETMCASSLECRWDTDRLWETWTHPGWKSGEKLEVSLGPGLSTRHCTHSLSRSCVEGCVVQLCEAWGCVDDRWAVRILRAICRGVNFQSRMGPPVGEVTSSMADPKRTWNPVTRHPPSGNRATAHWGSLGWRVFIQKDVIQLCLDWPWLLL